MPDLSPSLLRSRPAARPTVAAPGTEEKILEMIERFRRKEDLFHPEDGSAAADLSPGAVAPVTERLRNPRRCRGVEREKNHFRARPYWLRTKWPLGNHPTHRDACEVVEEFRAEAAAIERFVERIIERVADAIAARATAVALFQDRKKVVAIVGRVGLQMAEILGAGADDES